MRLFLSIVALFCLAGLPVNCFLRSMFPSTDPVNANIDLSKKPSSSDPDDGALYLTPYIEKGNSLGIFFSTSLYLCKFSFFFTV